MILRESIFQRNMCISKPSCGLVNFVTVPDNRLGFASRREFSSDPCPSRSTPGPPGGKRFGGYLSARQFFEPLENRGRFHPALSIAYASDVATECSEGMLGCYAIHHGRRRLHCSEHMHPAHSRTHLQCSGYLCRAAGPPQTSCSGFPLPDAGRRSAGSKDRAALVLACPASPGWPALGRYLHVRLWAAASKKPGSVMGRDCALATPSSALPARRMLASNYLWLTARSSSDKPSYAKGDCFQRSSPGKAANFP